MITRCALLILGLAVCAMSQPGGVSRAQIEVGKRQRIAIDAGDAARAKGDWAVAGRYYVEAIEIGRTSLEQLYATQDEALEKLALVLGKQNKLEAAEMAYLDRVDVAEHYSIKGELKIGRALFDLQCFYGAQGNVDRAVEITRRAVEFYANYKALGDNTATADRELASIEGIMGLTYFHAKRFADAEPWLRKVLARSDEAVVPSIMLASLRASAAVMLQNGDRDEASRLSSRAAAFERAHPEGAR